MIIAKTLEAMPKAAKVSFLQSHIAAIKAYIAALPEGGEKNDAVLELNFHNQLLAQAKQS